MERKFNSGWVWKDGSGNGEEACRGGTGAVGGRRWGWREQQSLCEGGMEIGREDRVALSVGFNREAGSLEAFRVIAKGGCVVEIRRRPMLAPRKMAELLSEQRSTVAWMREGELERLG